MKLHRHLATEEMDAVEADIEALAAQQPYIEEWDGYDLDKTLFRHDTWKGVLHFGEPIMPMIEHLKANVASGKRVKIFTARVSYDDERVNTAARKAIQDLLFTHVGKVLEVTCKKDMGMRNLYDDRAWRVEANQGTIVGQNKYPAGAVDQFHKDLKAELGQT